jgi:hypothetical protein
MRWLVGNIEFHASMDLLYFHIHSDSSVKTITVWLKTSEAEVFAQQLLNNVQRIRDVQRKRQEIKQLEGG